VALVFLNFKKIFISIILLRFLYSESGSSIGFCDFGSKYVSGWIPTTLVAILTVITILSFLYFFSTFLGGYGARLKIQLKEEFVQVVITIFLISSIVLILKPSCDLLQNVGEILGQTGDPFQQSELYLQSLLIKGINLYTEGYLYEVRFLILGKLVQNVPNLEFWKISCESGATSTPYINLLMTLDSIINALITVAYSSFYFLLIILGFAKEYAFQIILPIGIVCRVIPQTRRASDFFIALSIGLYIFLPALLMMNAYIASNIKSIQLETPQSAKDLQDYLSPASQAFNALNIGISAINIFKVFNFNQFLQEIAWYDFFAFFMLGMDIALVTAFVETLGNALSIGFGSLTTRLREAYAPG